jgi:hypothetical protein
VDCIGLHLASSKETKNLFIVIGLDIELVDSYVYHSQRADHGSKKLEQYVIFSIGNILTETPRFPRTRVVSPGFPQLHCLNN